jgi:hypothetical protein
MRTIPTPLPRSNADQIINTHSRHAASCWRHPSDIDAPNDDALDARARRLTDKIAELTSAVFDLFDDLTIDIEVVVAKLVRFNASVIATRPLTHVDELLDDLHTMWSHGMTTGDAEIDRLLSSAFAPW